MLFRRKPQAESGQPSAHEQAEVSQVQLHAHKYSIQFDIAPEISYLDDRRCLLLTEFFPLFDGFPDDVWMAQQAIDEGLDFCKITFWIFAEQPDAIKEFSIWFEAFFRDEGVLDLLERFVKGTLEDAEDMEVTLADWARVHVPEAEVAQLVEQERGTSVKTTPASGQKQR